MKVMCFDSHQCLGALRSGALRKIAIVPQEWTMTLTLKVFAAAIIATASAGLLGVSQAAPIAPVQSAAGRTDVTPVYYRGHHYRHHYRPHHYRRYGYYGRRPYYDGGYYGSYAYVPAGSDDSYGYQPQWYHYGTYCPYYGHQNMWWCH
jgi:hypothetical protein